MLLEATRWRWYSSCWDRMRIPTSKTLLDKLCELLLFIPFPSIMAKPDWQPLLIAARMNNVEVAILLLSFGANPSLKDNRGKTWKSYVMNEEGVRQIVGMHSFRILRILEVLASIWGLILRAVEGSPLMFNNDTLHHSKTQMHTRNSSGRKNDRKRRRNERKKRSLRSQLMVNPLSIHAILSLTQFIIFIFSVSLKAHLPTPS